MADYSKMTNEDFHNCLIDVIRNEDLAIEDWLMIPGIYEIMREYYNNEVLDLWAEDNPELAWPEDYLDEEDNE